MYSLRTENSFDSAHFLHQYDGKCSNIHGHRWRVIIEIKGDRLDSEGQERGMLVDFGVLKKDLKEEVDKLDHALIVEENSLKQELLDMLRESNFNVIEIPFRSTAENMAFYFYDVMKKRGYNVKEATVYETPNNSASYCED